MLVILESVFIYLRYCALHRLLILIMLLFSFDSLQIQKKTQTRLI